MKFDDLVRGVAYHRGVAIYLETVALRIKTPMDKQSLAILANREWVLSLINLLDAFVAQPFSPFECDECGGLVRMSSHTGMTWSVVPGEFVQVPDYVRLPKCDACGECYLGPGHSEMVDRAVRLELERTPTGEKEGGS